MQARASLQGGTEAVVAGGLQRRQTRPLEGCRATFREGAAVCLLSDGTGEGCRGGRRGRRSPADGAREVAFGVGCRPERRGEPARAPTGRGRAPGAEPRSLRSAF